MAAQPAPERSGIAVSLRRQGTPWPLLAFLAVLAASPFFRAATPSAEAAPSAATLRDLAYGPDPHQRVDVYLPSNPVNAPTLVYVHGGGWQGGDKASPSAIDAKRRRWNALGAIVVSVDYRRVPTVDPIEQARDVGRALAWAQARAARAGGDPDAFALIGHSAGAHLVALLAAAPDLQRDAGVRPWRATVLLDSAAVDVVATMQAPPDRPMFAQAFGDDPAFWQAASPRHRLKAATAPILAVCAEARPDACTRNRDFLARAAAFGTRTRLLPVALDHGGINRRLGEDNAYTLAVEAFLREAGLRLDRDDATGERLQAPSGIAPRP